MIVAPRDRHRAQPEEREPQEAALEERVLRGEAHAPAARREDQHRIEQRVRVVSGEEHRAVRRHVLRPDHLDLTEERAHDEAQEPPQDPISHRGAACA